MSFKELCASHKLTQTEVKVLYKFFYKKNIADSEINTITTSYKSIMIPMGKPQHIYESC